MFARCLTLLLLGTALASAQAYAMPQDDPDDTPLLGGALEDLCRDGGGASRLLCSSYLRGSLEGLILGQGSMTDGELSFCLPDRGVSTRVLRDTFLHFVSEEGERRSEVAGMLLLYSLEDRFPCAEDDEDAQMLDYAAARAHPRSRTLRKS